jgi:transcription elongation factor Elf1
MTREIKANKVRCCPECGDTEVINVTRLVTRNNKRVRCLCTECDICGFRFELKELPQE